MAGHEQQHQTATSAPLPSKKKRKSRRNVLLVISAILGLATLCVAAGAWVGVLASTVSKELTVATELANTLKEEISANKPEQAALTVKEIRLHTNRARSAASDPIWSIAAAMPWIGPNLVATAEVARSADDVANLGLAPLVGVYGSLDWPTLVPGARGSDLAPIKAASPSVNSAAHAVRLSYDRLEQIDIKVLLPAVAEPIERAKGQLQQLSGALNAAADVTKIAPAMLGEETPRNYLLMIQNNAEARSSGGIPGALAILKVANGRLELGSQSSAADLGIMSPPLPVDEEQRQIFSSRMTKFMQDVNLTPDFPTAAQTAQAMWEKKTGQRVDGVVSIDPVALGYVLDATGPVQISGQELLAMTSGTLPTELNGKNVVPTLLSVIYHTIDNPKLQDAYFAGIASEVFGALSAETVDARGVISGLTKATAEGRVLVWASDPAEESVLARYPLGGSISGSSSAPAQFGVYFNDGTGAKMDYYVRRRVQLVKECPQDGYEQTTVRITSTNGAPADAAESLPPYVTGAGLYGVPPGSVQTNVVAYGPPQALVETAMLDGQRTDFAPYFHSNRPVGVLAVRLAPGESKTVEFTFGKIVQHTQPNLVVTPTVEDVKDVILPTESAACG